MCIHGVVLSLKKHRDNFTFYKERGGTEMYRSDRDCFAYSLENKLRELLGI
jgi:hypothetical protein